MNREGKHYFEYTRVSTEMQVEGYSLEGQENCIKKYADREEMICVGKYKDAGKSGKSIEGRPDFKRMLKDIQNGTKVDFVIVYKLSRFGRNAADILNSLELIQSYGVELICVEEGIDSSQTSGKLLISVLSAVAEIERENILEQTMNGRREKARQGLWNGGPAPYGYILKDNKLFINEEEAEIVRTIFDKFISTKIGYGGIAKYLNYQGIKKNPNCKMALDTWSGPFVKDVLDNPVYCGKIAYGRRVRERKKGSKYEYITVNSDDYILVDGQHDPIISEEIWETAHQKRLRTGLKPKAKTGQERKHLLTGLLRCPKCGGLMYCNRHAWTNKDGTYKDVYYYYCGHSDGTRGAICDYKAKLKKIDIEPLVVALIKKIVSDKQFASEIQNRIGLQADSSVVDKELYNFRNKLKEVESNKLRLEQEIDNMPLDAKFRERKINDMTARLESLYDTMIELEELIKDAELRKQALEEDVVSMESIYRILLSFSEIYDMMDDTERKNLMSYLIKRIDIYANDEGTSQILKSIEFNFPIYKDGAFVRKILWDESVNVETLVCLSKKVQVIS